MKRDLIYGFGINDMPGVSGKSKRSVDRSIYSIWFNMIQRCYSEKTRHKYPTYKDCSVCDDWRFLSGFYEWAKPRFKPGMQLDKDLLFAGNSTYGPEFCVFVKSSVNKFILTQKTERKIGQLDGVYLRKKTGRYLSQISNPYSGEKEYLGSFGSEIEAHIVWAKRKLDLAYRLSELCDNEDVVSAIICRQKEILKRALSCQ